MLRRVFKRQAMETYTNVTVQVLQSAAKVRCRRLEGTASQERCILCEKTVWKEKSYSAFEYEPQFEVQLLKLYVSVPGPGEATGI